MSKNTDRHASSFRDPAGFIFEHHGKTYRQINKEGQVDYDFLVSSGLYDELIGRGWLIAHQEVNRLSNLPIFPKRYKIIQPEPIPFISYPYEWSFSQLKEAALLTLKIQKVALQKGMILKDASAYNIQFVGDRAVFIDTLSFRVYKPGSPWDGYKQFCQHFLATLALASYTQPEIIRTLRVFLDGLPLELSANLLPTRSRGRWGLLTHLYLHSASQKRHDNSEASYESKSRQVSPMAINGLISSLERAVSKLNLPDRQTEWGDYYNNTNYSDRAFTAKKEAVRGLLAKISPKPKLTWDLGANDGTFSQLTAELGAYSVAFDVDYRAVERNLAAKRPAGLQKIILPLVQDLTNPSTSLGWAHGERLSLKQRGPADVVLALALVHHLAIGNNLPLTEIASFFKDISRWLIIEFVPKEDSKAKLLLRGRNNIFHDYSQQSFEEAFGEYFNQVDKKALAQSQRVIYLYKAKK